MASLSKGFNTDILSSVLQDEMDKVMRKFADQKGNLLMRCIQCQRLKEEGGDRGNKTEVSHSEARFLEENFIAEIKHGTYRDYGGGSDSYYTITKFTAPWDTIMSGLVQEMKAGPRPKTPKPD